MDDSNSYRPFFIYMIMNEDFTNYDIKPKEFINYLRYYGSHFNKRLCEFACKQFSKNEITKDSLSSLLQNNGIKINEIYLYDALYIANWCKSTFYGSSISDERHLVLFIKDVIDKESNLIFNRWFADMAKQGVPIEWEDMI